MEAFLLSKINKGANLGGLVYFGINNQAVQRFQQDFKGAIYDVLSRMVTTSVLAVPIQFLYDLLPFPTFLVNNQLEVVTVLVYLAYMYPVTNTIILPIEQFIRSAFAEIE
jgi:hypothetical protein